MGTKPISLYYFRSKDGLLNFGDDLSPILVERLTGRPVRWAHPTRCDLAAIGSILQRLEKHRKKRIFTAFGRKITLWGTGLIEPAMVKSADYNVLALRGPSTAKALGLVGDNAPAYGDPGLLFDRLIARPNAASHSVGIIPHYRDLDHPAVKAMLDAMPRAALISVRDEPVSVLKKIAACDAIISSSLHGLIAADCFGIPNWRVHFGDEIYGGDFKYLDYAAAIGRHDISARKPDMFSEKFCAEPDADFAYFKTISPIADRLEKQLKDWA